MDIETAKDIALATGFVTLTLLGIVCWAGGIRSLRAALENIAQRRAYHRSRHWGRRRREKF